MSTEFELLSEGHITLYVEESSAKASLYIYDSYADKTTNILTDLTEKQLKKLITKLQEFISFDTLN